MKICDRNLMGTAATDAGRAAEVHNTDGGRSAAGSSGRAGDRVEFSGGLGALSRAVSADDSSRAQRIQALAGQVQNGNYHPDARAISRGMVEDAMAAR